MAHIQTTLGAEGNEDPLHDQERIVELAKSALGDLPNYHLISHWATNKREVAKKTAMSRHPSNKQIDTVLHYI